MNMVLIPKMSVIIHTCDAYAFCWKGCLHYFDKYWNNWEYPVYFCNEVQEVFYPRIKNLRSGKSEWSDRLITILNNVDTKYVFYLQEDMWLNKGLPSDMIPYLIELMENNDLFCIHICPPNAFYATLPSSLKSKYEVLPFNPKGKYLMNHQPAIWHRSFLRECLVPNESPWINEIDGTSRLRKIKRKWKGKISIHYKEWYTPVCIKGKLTEFGKTFNEKRVSK